MAIPVTTSQMMSSRLEVKYLVDRTTRTALARDLRAFMSPDTHSAKDGAYFVRSLYFDSPDYICYHSKMGGEAARHKLRVRVYGDDPGRAQQVRLEVKSRYLSMVKKVTADLSWEDYADVEQAVARHTLPPERVMNGAPGTKEFFRLQKLYNMEPKILIQYRRQALERMEMGRIRVNLDDQMVATRNLDLRGNLRGARRLMQHGHAIFEIKVGTFLPSWLHTLISKYDLWNSALSKFCFAVRSEAMLSTVARQED